MEIQTSKLSYAQAINYLAAGLGDKVMYGSFAIPVIRMVKGKAINVKDFPKEAWDCNCGCMEEDSWRLLNDT